MLSARVPYDAAAVLAGDESAFTRLFDAHASELLRFAASIGDPVSAEDIVTDAYWNLWTKRTSLPRDANLRAYLYRSVRNGMLNHLRTRRREDTRFAAIQEQGDIPAVDMDRLPVDEQLEHDDLTNRLWRLVNTFAEPRRSIVFLRWTRGMSFDEIAYVLDVPAGTVRSHATRALQVLRQLIP